MIHNEIDCEVGRNDFTGSVKTYYQELKRHKPMPKEEERRLMELAKAGDVDARNRILSANLRFVFDVAKKYRGNGVDIADLIAEGNKGMLIAIDKFDMSQDVKFFSYAVWWIRHKMAMAVQKKAERDAMELSIEDVFSKPWNDDEAVENIYPEDDPFYEDDPVGNDGNDLVSCEEAEQKHFVVEKLLATLDDRERLIISKYFGIDGDDEGHGFDEIGMELNLTTERVRQLKVKAINELRAQVFSIGEAQFLF